MQQSRPKTYCSVSYISTVLGPLSRLPCGYWMAMDHTVPAGETHLHVQGKVEVCSLQARSDS